MTQNEITTAKENRLEEMRSGKYVTINMARVLMEMAKTGELPLSGLTDSERALWNMFSDNT